MLRRPHETARAYIDTITERAQRAEETKEPEARSRVAEERLKIARDLHDVMAHQIAVINMHAGVASQALPTRPEAAERALATIRQAARTVLGEIASLLRVLRAADPALAGQPPDLAPVPGLSQLPRLVTDFTRGGLRIDLRTVGKPVELPAAVDMVAYRVIQEGLTNAQKHGSDSSALLQVEYDQQLLEVSVTNTVTRTTSAAHQLAGGHGLIGARERVAAVQGAFGHQLRPRPGPPAGRPAAPAPAGLRDDDDGRLVITVLLADDQTLIRTAVAELVAHEDGLTVIGEATNGAEAVQQVRTLGPDIVLMDIRMPILDGIEATRQICADPHLAGTRIIVLTTFEEDEYVLQVLRAGASGFIGKGAEASHLMEAIRTVHSGEALLSPRATRTLIDRYLSPATTPALKIPAELQLRTDREREILLLVGKGQSNQDIAQLLVISPQTAKTHLNRVMTKLHAHDRAQLVIIAYESGLLSAEQG